MQKLQNNEKGLTLVEVLGVLVLTAMILSSLIYLLNYTNTSLNQVSGREEVMQQSRDTVEHIVTTVRKGLIPTPLNGTSNNLFLNGINGQYAQYNFNSLTHTLEAVYRLANENGTLAASPTRLVLSDQVQNIRFDANNGKLQITLVMQLPNHTTKEILTTVYTTQR
jgi:hypothetical protein